MKCAHNQHCWNQWKQIEDQRKIETQSQKTELLSAYRLSRFNLQGDFESKTFEQHEFKGKRSLLDVPPDNKKNLEKYNLDLRQGNYQLFFSVEFPDGNRRRPWAVKTKLSWTLSGRTPKQIMAQVRMPAHAAFQRDR